MRTLARDRRTLGNCSCGRGCPEFCRIWFKGFAEVFLRLWVLPGCRSRFSTRFLPLFLQRIFSRKILQNASGNPSGRVPGASPEPPRTVPERLQTGSQSNFKKITPKVLTIIVKFTLFGSFWDPAGAPKSTKNGPGAEKVRPETVPETIFDDFARRCRSEPVSGPIFEGPDP